MSLAEIENGNENRAYEQLLPAGAELIETHISRVFLYEAEVFKLKKAVDLGFLDYSTLEQRRQACEAEVRLNRRLAPDVYLGVVPLIQRNEHLVFGGDETALDGAVLDGTVVDWAVHMRRLPDSERADQLLHKGLLSISDLRRIAETLARFHARARCDDQTTRFGEVEVIAANVQENFSQTAKTLLDYLSLEEAFEVESWQLDFLARHERDFFDRRQNGRVRDGHGDLRLEHLYLDEDRNVRILDGIEFNERFRFADVCADIAFLAMDLTWQGRPDLAENFLAFYARAAGDYDLYPLVDFYESYRAFVRGKISAMMAADLSQPLRKRERSKADARRYFLLSLAASRRSLLPARMIAIGGWIASGKSTLGEALSEELQVPIISADHTRKELLGCAAEEPVHEPAWQGAYAPEMNEKVYTEVLRRADAVLRSGRSVILDASFRSRRDRARARQVAKKHTQLFDFIECRASPELCRSRLRQREQSRSVSDGRLEIFDDFVAGYEPVDEFPAGEFVAVETEHPLADNLEQLRHRLGIA